MDDPTIRPTDDPTTPLDPIEPALEAPGTGGGTDTDAGDTPAFEAPAAGDDNIREGNVGGLMGGPNQQQGQGQGG